MNLYDVLRVLVTKAALPEVQQKDCLATLDEAERMNMLGTSAKRMDVQEHECVYPSGRYYGGHIDVRISGDQCIYCGKSRSE